jgi:hypothetical protein
MDIHLYQNRHGLWVARVTITDPNWDGVPYKLPPVITRYTEPDHFRHLALVLADRLITDMENVR